MTRQEWLTKAQQHERTAHEKREAGDDCAADYHERTAQACRTAADYAPDEPRDNTR